MKDVGVQGEKAMKEPCGVGLVPCGFPLARCPACKAHSASLREP